MVRQQGGVVAAEEHSGRKVAHHGFGLNVKVSEHLVGLPSAKEADAIGIDIRTEESHGAGCPQGPGGHVQGEKTVGGSENGH